jgi:hypothetical protein
MHLSALKNAIRKRLISFCMTPLREAATKNLDLSVAKSLGPERFRAQFRGEFLNLFNHPIYGKEFYGGSSGIGNCLNCGNLGLITIRATIHGSFRSAEVDVLN